MVHDDDNDDDDYDYDKDYNKINSALQTSERSCGTVKQIQLLRLPKYLRQDKA
jgi:hypothetical protein